jgi:hypothetical protein
MKASTLAHGPTLHGLAGTFHMDSYQPTIVSGLYHNVPYSQRYCTFRYTTRSHWLYMNGIILLWYANMKYAPCMCIDAKWMKSVPLTCTMCNERHVKVAMYKSQYQDLKLTDHNTFHQDHSNKCNRHIQSCLVPSKCLRRRNQCECYRANRDYYRSSYFHEGEA